MSDTPGVGVDGLYVHYCGADASIPLSRNASRMALDASSSKLYVLDDFGGVSRWNRSPFDCGWELDRNWGSSGGLQFDGFPADLDLSTSGSLTVKDGSKLLTLNSDTCFAGPGVFALSPDGASFVLGSVLGSQRWSKSGSGCVSLGVPVGFGTALAVDANTDGWLSVESVGGTRPERLVSYSLDGQAQWIRPLSPDALSEPYLCSASRVRSDHFHILVLDKNCGRLAAFDRQGAWLGTMQLDSLGISRSRVLDVSLPETGVAEILIDDPALTVQLSWRSLLGNGAGGVISP